MAPNKVEPQFWLDYIKTRPDPEGQKAFVFNNNVMEHCKGDKQELVKMLDREWYDRAIIGSKLPVNAHPDQKTLVRQVASEYNASEDDIERAGTFIADVISASTDNDGVLQLFNIWEAIGALWTQSGNTVELDKNIWSFVYWTVLESVDSHVDPQQWEQV